MADHSISVTSLHTDCRRTTSAVRYDSEPHLPAYRWHTLVVSFDIWSGTVGTSPACFIIKSHFICTDAKKSHPRHWSLASYVITCMTAFNNDGSKFYILNFYARQHICHSAYAIARPSVCLSDGGIIEKWLKLGVWNFHHTVAPSL